ncbi:MAG: aldolase/citrate lyase family protein [Lamprobacter sp.]|uniref:aldolase/citrate lyase family protein n=1 Tax=Lamprobacter sp. TaxID=3100796 RepID=UPI002B25919E|nr:aldolase/citrate lyase family protein [Lamprobacter sp.]MEA3641483.1 aldolase/citrate lyase family protein [Lamprobacter sp.]
MNYREREMLDLLKKGREKFGYIGVKAEFEAEGTRMEELLRLLDIARRADVKIGLKIGGCEAIRDLLEAKQLGVDYIIAPMIETPYALTKFIDAINKVYNGDERADTRFLFNLETQYSFSQLEHLMAKASQPRGVDGVVFGRVDYTLSHGFSREVINSPVITKDCMIVAQACQEHDLEYVVGGGVSIESLPIMQQLQAIHLDRFETRKIIFNADIVKETCIQEGLLNAVRFELLWLLNKRDYYKHIEIEDDRRIEMLESRWKVLNARDL